MYAQVTGTIIDQSRVYLKQTAKPDNAHMIISFADMQLWEWGNHGGFFQYFKKPTRTDSMEQSLILCKDLWIMHEGVKKMQSHSTEIRVFRIMDSPLEQAWAGQW